MRSRPVLQVDMVGSVESLLLVHSPLVGPSSWEPVADSAAARGFEVAVPDLAPVARLMGGWGQALSDTATRSVSDLGDGVIVVGHSGAGPYLPLIAESLGGRVSSLVFVDAALPPATGSYSVDERMSELLDSKTKNGILLPWLDWWPTEDIDEMLPDRDSQRLLREDMPRLPRRFYVEEVAAPHGWTARQCGYIKLSDAYTAEYETAKARGWRLGEMDGTHLSLVTDPGLVHDQIETVGSPPRPRI